MGEKEECERAKANRTSGLHFCNAHFLRVYLFIGCDAKTPKIGKRRPIVENKTRTAIEEPLKGNEENKRVDRVTEY